MRFKSDKKQSFVKRLNVGLGNVLTGCTLMGDRVF